MLPRLIYKAFPRTLRCPCCVKSPDFRISGFQDGIDIWPLFITIKKQII